MKYIELKCKRPDNQEEFEILIAELADIGFESFMEEEDELLSYIPQKDFLREKIYQIELCRKQDNGSGLSVRLVEEQNWNALWESNYPPVKIADRCYIRSTFHDPDDSAEFDILLRPKMAFGTAHHETTALMIELLLDEQLKDKRVLDMGSGTGVLAILASLKGASYVAAIDNDEWAYRNAVENAALNNIKGIKTRVGDASVLKDEEPFDLILANINKNILLSDLTHYAKSLHEDGNIFFSGFYLEDLPAIRKAAEQNGLKFVTHLSKNKWTAAIFHKQ